jgi:hypothetical protein
MDESLLPGRILGDSPFLHTDIRDLRISGRLKVGGPAMTKPVLDAAVGAQREEA